MTLDEKVYEVVSKIPKGKVMTYGGVAETLGNKDLARAVGNSLNRNPNPIKVPCHRIINSDGKVGGYSKRVDKKIKLLEDEGIVIKNSRIPQKYIINKPT